MKWELAGADQERPGLAGRPAPFHIWTMTKTPPIPGKPPAKAELPTSPPTPAHKLPPVKKVAEIGGPEGPEPTRYGDWERKGRVSDF